MPQRHSYDDGSPAAMMTRIESVIVAVGQVPKKLASPR